MKNKEKINLLILLGLLFLSACAASDVPQSYEENDISMEEPEEKTVFTEQEESEETEDSEMFKLYKELAESAQYDWEWVIEPGEYEDFTFLGGTYIAVKKENGKYSVIDENGDFVFRDEYDYISPYSENMAHAENDGNIFYLDEDGNRVIQGDFESARNFYGQRAAVQMDGKWGHIDQTGQVVVELMYDDAGSFSERKAPVEQDNYYEDGVKAWAYINPENTVVIDWFPCYGSAAFREYAGVCLYG